MTTRTLLNIIRSDRLSARSEREIIALFSHSHGPLLPIRMKVLLCGRCVVVDGWFKNCETGRSAGEFYRELRVRKGEIVIHHGGIRLTPSVRNSGWGRKWFKECERRYREFGIASISTRAGSDGGYVWAREGFSLATAGQESFWTYVDKRLLCLHEEELIDAKTLVRWERDISSGRICTVAQIMRLGQRTRWVDSDGHRCWPGKLLLIGSGWNGVKRLG